jgi:hypothetical protein
MNNYDDIHMSNRDMIIRQNATFLKDKVFLEFGVYMGTSMLQWHEVYNNNDVPIDFVGFDSFQGIPEETEDKNNLHGWRVGSFSTAGAVNPNLLSKKDIRLVHGFFNDSLNDETAKMLGGSKVGLVHIDCDTYSSTKTVWEWLLKYDLLAEGAIIVYDDWGGYLEAGCGEYEIGEAKAHIEIEKTHNIQFTDLGKYVVDPRFYEVKTYKYK